MGSVYFLVFFLLCCIVHAYSAGDRNTRQNVQDCPKSFVCGKLGSIGYPFTNQSCPRPDWLSVSDCGKETHKIQFHKRGRTYGFVNISQSDIVLINDPELKESLVHKNCSYFEDLEDLVLHNTSLVSFRVDGGLSMVKCYHTPPPPPFQSHILQVNCSDYGYSIYHSSDSDSKALPSHCSVIQLGVNLTAINDSDLFSLLSAEFSLQLVTSPDCASCLHFGGECEHDSKGSLHCARGKGKLSLKLPGFLAAVAVLIIISVFFVSRKCAQTNPRMFWKRKKDNFKNIEVFLVELGSLCPKRFSFSDIKKITNSFKDKLGEGGFGGVYRGNLQDGRPVAVKVLKGSKGNGEDFINEVSSISRTSHVNVVTLLGFCFEGRKRALVYEFMPNGSLEKLIYEKSPLTSDRQLKWETLYKIAVGIARGLEYLHRGCNTRILHFDIKPHNILLDEDFCPKISDFGLAKICPRKESIVSMLGARGTPGYIAPEVFSRNFGGVSHKSDVYSYGMMVLEMVGGRRNIDCEADRTSELYFPHWIYKRIELHQELGLHGIADDEEKEEARKMIIVSMWCIQTDPSNRPPMSRVVEMLEGGIDSLQIPPKPFLSSPSRSPGSDSPVIVTSYSSVT